MQQFSLTLSTVAACVTLRAGAGVLSAAASIHTPDVTGLNCRWEERERFLMSWKSTKKAKKTHVNRKKKNQHPIFINCYYYPNLSFEKWAWIVWRFRLLHYYYPIKTPWTVFISKHLTVISEPRLLKHFTIIFPLELGFYNSDVSLSALDEQARLMPPGHKTKANQADWG